MTPEQADELLNGGSNSWVDEAREMVRDADRAMDIGAKGDTLRSMNGITHLSDSAAPDAYFGWKS